MRNECRFLASGDIRWYPLKYVSYSLISVEMRFMSFLILWMNVHPKYHKGHKTHISGCQKSAFVSHAFALSGIVWQGHKVEDSSWHAICTYYFFTLWGRVYRLWHMKFLDLKNKEWLCTFEMSTNFPDDDGSAQENVMWSTVMPHNTLDSRPVWYEPRSLFSNTVLK